MVHVERYPPDNLRNGRSRGPSPNGHNGSPDTSDDDSTKNAKGNNKTAKAKSEYEEKIRVGKDYQTTCPDFIPLPERKLETLPDRALLVWSPTKDIPDNKLEDYITVAKEKYGYNGEQALGMLFWHKHDLERAVQDLANFTPFPDEWTEEDKVLFEQAFHFHGKSFHRIRQMLPDKNIASLVKYYYSWKKTRSRTSVMDRQEKMKAKEGSENGSENGSNDDSDTEDKKWPLHRGIRRADSRSPPPRNSDDSSNSVSSSAMKQAPNVVNSNGTTTATVNSAGGDNTATAINPTANNANSNHSNINNNATAIGANALPPHTNDKDSGVAQATATVKEANAADGSNSTDSLTAGNANNHTKDCFNCGVPCTQANASPHGALCNSCYHHWSRTGSLRPTSGPGYGKRSRNSTNNGVERHKSKLPRGMYINHDDIVALASQANDNNGRGDDLLTSMDREISSLLSQIQNNKQIVSSLKNKNVNQSLEALTPNDASTNRIVARWNNDEYQIVNAALRKHGKDFQAIADILGTKSEQHVRTYYASFRKKHNLDALIKEYEAEQEQQQTQSSNDDPPKTSPSSSSDVKSDIKLADDRIMEIDLVDDIPNNKEDEDMDDVTIIESDSSPSTTISTTTSIQKQSNGMNVDQALAAVEPMDSISITAITSNSGGSQQITHEPIPEVTISPAVSSHSTSAQATLASVVNATVSSTSSSLLSIVEQQAKATAV